jgi:thioester reductase-like protein
LSVAGHGGETLLVTGFPAFPARRLVEQLLASEPDASLITLVRPADEPAAEAFANGLELAARERLRTRIADPCALDFGLSGPAYLELTRSVDRVYHFASRFEASAGEAGASQNLAAARELIEFARASSRLRGTVLLSSAFVSGLRSGVVLETELNAGQRFHGPVEESLATVEAMLERHPELPALIVRPTQIVGDAQSGEIEQPEWPYPLIAWVVNGPAEISLALPRAQAAVQIVPIDFVLRATQRLAQDASHYGRRYHLVDEHPPTLEELVVLLAEQCNKRIAPAANAFARGLGSLRLLSDSMRALFEAPGADARYDDAQARAALADSGLVCPPLESYLPALVDFVNREPPKEPAPAR